MGVVPAFPQGRPLTWADLGSIPDDGYRYELVDGVLLMSPSPRPVHQRVVARLLGILTSGCPREWEVLPAPVDVILADDTVLIPDVVIGRRDAFGERGLQGPPILSIEVVSRSSRLMDTRLKPARLAEAGCPHYWYVEPDVPRVSCFTLREGEYVERVVVAGEEIAEITEPYPIKLCADSLVTPYLE